MNQLNQIRVLALGLIIHNGRTLLCQGYDPMKQQSFYRALGGGVEFGETSLEALRREFNEEIQAELTHIRLLDCLENLFVFNNKPGHEIVFLYQCDLINPKFYQVEQINFIDGECKQTAVWAEIERCKSGELRVVPEKCLEYL